MQEICTKDSAAQRLIKSNCLKEVKVLPLPSPNVDVCQVYKDNGLPLTEYQQDETGLALKLSNGGWYSVMAGLQKGRGQPVVPGSLVTHADVLATKHFDYLVVGKADPILSSTRYNRNIIADNHAIELVRILLINNGFFYVTSSNSLTDEFRCDIYRFNKLFNKFHHAWAVAVYAHGKGISEEVYDYLDNLSSRLHLTCKAYDKACFFALKSANNSTQDNELYHLAYYIMLITGVFDTLAHIIDKYYHLNIVSNFDITIRKRPQKYKRQLLTVLLDLNKSLCEYLVSDMTQNRINAFYPIRDSLQHRELLKGMRYSDGQNADKNLFQLSDEAVKNLTAVSSEVTCIIDLHKPYLDPFAFISWAQSVLIDIVNSTLSYIDWDSARSSLSDGINEQIRQSNELNSQNLGKFLGLTGGDLPLYF